MAVDIDTIRALVGDQDESTQLLDDDTITLIATPYASSIAGAAAVADAIAAKFARKVDFRLEGLSFSNSQKATAYMALAQRLRVQANNDDSSNIGVVSTGTSLGEMDGVISDPDRPDNLFQIGMQQDPQVRHRPDVGPGNPDEPL